MAPGAWLYYIWVNYVRWRGGGEEEEEDRQKGGRGKAA